MEYKDYYKILGVEKSASQEDIKRAYRRLARKYHPDVSKEKDASQRFQEINEAHEALGDPEKRKAYDQAGRNWQGGRGFQPPPGWQQRARQGGAGGFEGGAEFSDFFSSLFGNMGGQPGPGFGGAHHTRMKGEDVDASIRIPIEDAYNGATRSLTLNIPERSPQGFTTSRRRSLNVKIPKGVTENQRIRLEGQGGPGVGGAAAGDLLMKVEFETHPHYRAQGKDIYLNLPITPWEAALGRTVKVPTLGGTVDLKIPKNTSTGQQLRLKGRGLPGKTPGNQYVVFEIVMPKECNDEVRALYAQLAEHEAAFNPRSKLGV